MTNVRWICFAIFLHSQVWTFEAFKQMSPFVHCMDLYHLMTPNDAINSISFKTTKAVIEIRLESEGCFWKRSISPLGNPGFPVRLDYRHWRLGTYLTTWPVSHPILRDYGNYQVAFMTSVAILELRDDCYPQFDSSDSLEPQSKNTKKSLSRGVRVVSLRMESRSFHHQRMFSPIQSNLLHKKIASVSG